MCEKTAKRRLGRSLPLNIMTAAARMDEAVEEQGLNAWISPDKGVIIEGEVDTDHDTKRHHSETPTAETLIGDREEKRESGEREESEADPLMVWDAALGDAATRGMKALQDCWSSVPPAHKPALKAALDRRHKVTAAKVDAPDAGVQPPASEQAAGQPTPANEPTAEADAQAPSVARLL
jgi:hypothetical protein